MIFNLKWSIFLYIIYIIHVCSGHLLKGMHTRDRARLVLRAREYEYYSDYMDENEADMLANLYEIFGPTVNSTDYYDNETIPDAINDYDHDAFPNNTHTELQNSDKDIYEPLEKTDEKEKRNKSVIKFINTIMTFLKIASIIFRPNNAKAQVTINNIKNNDIAAEFMIKNYTGNATVTAKNDERSNNDDANMWRDVAIMIAALVAGSLILLYVAYKLRTCAQGDYYDPGSQFTDSTV